jgi:hypothetical protein
MRLSEWRAESPSREATGQKVNALVDPILLALGASPDPTAWVEWGEEPAIRYTVLAPAPAGLISCFVRVNVPGEGPRATAKLIRWSRVQLGELAIETQGGHRLLTFQIEQLVLRGADEAADRVGRFAAELFAAVDGRPVPEPAAGRATGSVASRRTTGRAKPAGRAATAGTRAASGPAGIPAKTGAGRAAGGSQPRRA